MKNESREPIVYDPYNSQRVYYLPDPDHLFGLVILYPLHPYC